MVLFVEGSFELFIDEFEVFGGFGLNLFFGVEEIVFFGELEFEVFFLVLEDLLASIKDKVGHFI